MFQGLGAGAAKLVQRVRRMRSGSRMAKASTSRTRKPFDENEWRSAGKRSFQTTPPPGPKWKARKGLARMKLNGAEHDIMECLIDRASKAKGLCFPSEEFIAGWTTRPLRTVERGIASLKCRG